MAIPDKPEWFEPRTLYLRRPRGMRCGRRPGPGGIDVVDAVWCWYSGGDRKTLYVLNTDRDGNRYAQPFVDQQDAQEVFEQGFRRGEACLFMLRRTARFPGGVCGISRWICSASIRSTSTPGVHIDRHVFQREASPPGAQMSIAS